MKEALERFPDKQGEIKFVSLKTLKKGMRDK
jgi:hypothetical protein